MWCDPNPALGSAASCVLGGILLGLWLAFPHWWVCAAAILVLMAWLHYTPRGEHHSDRVFVSHRLHESMLVPGATSSETELRVHCPAYDSVLPLGARAVARDSYACGQLGFAIVRKSPFTSRYRDEHTLDRDEHTLVVWRRHRVLEARRGWWKLRPAPRSGRSQLEAQQEGHDESAA